ncbi:unnamed protein product [Paramecium pentaurelia]|uniref:Uncharacterized protein n=1 Tax=Paramecium pentaurelia TaxID=43138 RepID=A0A8S1V5A0_9CILI|nr:unnamed protein product [Paramecium pentaurelia]
MDKTVSLQAEKDLCTQYFDDGKCLKVYLKNKTAIWFFQIIQVRKTICENSSFTLEQYLSECKD